MAAQKKIQQLTDLQADPANVNKGTERGRQVIDWSLTELGAGRSILADSDGVVIAGNKTLAVAVNHQIPVRVVETDGTELIVVQRTDLRLLGNGAERDKARQLAIADNRASEVGYSPDVEILLEHAQTVELSPMYREDEIDLYIESLTPLNARSSEPQTAESLWQGMPEFDQPNAVYRTIHVHFDSDADVERFAKRMEQVITEKTRSIWFPYKPPENLKQYVVEDES